MPKRKKSGAAVTEKEAKANKKARAAALQNRLLKMRSGAAVTGATGGALGAAVKKVVKTLKRRSGGAITAKERAKNRRIRAAASAVVKGAVGGGLGKIVSRSVKGGLGGLKRKSGAAVTRAEIRKHLKSVEPGSAEARKLMNLLLSPASGGAVTAGEFSTYDKAAKKAAKIKALKKRSGAAVTKLEYKRAMKKK